MRNSELIKKQERETAAASQAGIYVENIANARFGDVREEVEQVFRLASEIAGEDVSLANLGDVFETPGERQAFYTRIFKAAFLTKLESADKGDEEPVVEKPVVDVEKPVVKDEPKVEQPVKAVKEAASKFSRLVSDKGKPFDTKR